MQARIDNIGVVIETPVIGNNIAILAGSIVGGPIIIGDNVAIGANTTVTRDMADGTLIFNSTGTSTRSFIIPGYKGAFYPQ